MVEVLEEPKGPPPLDWSKWDKGISPDEFAYSFDKQRDILFMHLLPKRPAVSLDVSGMLWVRFDPSSGEVVGLEIEDFEHVFLERHPELALAWPQIKPRIIKLPKRDGPDLEGYIRMLLSLVKELLGSNPPQLNLRSV